MTALPIFPRAPYAQSRAVRDGSVYKRVDSPDPRRLWCIACRVFAPRLLYDPARGYAVDLYCACCTDNHAHAVAP